MDQKDISVIIYKKSGKYCAEVHFNLRKQGSHAQPKTIEVINGGDTLEPFDDSELKLVLDLCKRVEEEWKIRR